MSEYNLQSIGDITDVRKTFKDEDEFVVMTKEGLKFCNITTYNVTLNKKEEYFKHKNVVGAFEYLPNVFIVALDTEQWLQKLDRKIKRSSNLVKN